MKRLVLLISILVSVSPILFAQTNQDNTNLRECDSLVIREYDKVTGETGIYGKPIFINNNKETGGIVINFIKRDKRIDFAINVGNACIDDTNKLNILFRNGSRLELENEAKYNCMGIHLQTLGGNRRRKKILEELITKEIEVIRVHTRTSYIEQSFKPEESQLFQNTLRCLSE